MYGFYFGYEEATLGVKLRYTWDTAMEFGRMVWMGLRQLITGQVGVKDMSGPVGIVDLMAETGQNAASTADAVYNILYLGAFIAVNLAIMNLLPIPALDGGRLLFLIVEAIRRKPIPPEKEGMVHAIGLILLFGLFIVLTYRDVVRLLTGGFNL